jgi:hypothetical protein
MSISVATMLLATVVGSLAGSQPPNAHNVFVDASASPGGDGSPTAPYQTITQAIERAREIRAELPAVHKIHVHVAPGEYVEDFPIYVNVSNVDLHGSTHLIEDENGLPANCGTDAVPVPCIEPGTETVMTPAVPFTSNTQVTLFIGPTVDSEDDRLNDVTVRGFVIDGKTINVANGGVGMFVDRVDNFSIQGNVTRRLLIGVRTDLSSGRIKGHFGYQSNDGLAIAGGSSIYPARVEAKANRLLNNLEQGLVALGTGSVKGRIRSPNLKPVQILFDPAQHPEQVPDTLVLSVVGNDMSGSPRFGMRLEGYISGNAFYDTTDNQPMTSHIVATIRENSFRNNGEYGVTVEGAFTTRTNPRIYTATFDGSFQRNDYSGSGRAGLFIGFMLNGVVTRNPGLLNQNKYLQNSTFVVNLLDEAGPVGIDYDNPVIDRYDGITPLNNVLQIDGVSFVGTHVTCPPGFPCVL